MTVKSVEQDIDNLTLVLTAEFDADVKQVWSLWEDPRKLERWWGPPTYPATFVEHDLAPGGRSHYYMTSPEGDHFHGLWTITAIDPHRSIEAVDVFADAEGNPSSELPSTTFQVSIDESEAGTRMVIRGVFSSKEAMEQLLAMGMAEGLAESVGQIDAILATAA